MANIPKGVLLPGKDAHFGDAKSVSYYTLFCACVISKWMFGDTGCLFTNREPDCQFQLNLDCHCRLFGEFDLFTNSPVGLDQLDSRSGSKQPVSLMLSNAATMLRGLTIQ